MTMPRDRDPKAAFPPSETLGAAGDLSSATGPTAAEEVRRLALRKLFHSAEFNRCDGLDDYGEDFHSFEPLKGIVTADMRHRLEREKEGRPERPVDGLASDCKEEPSTRTPAADPPGLLPSATSARDAAVPEPVSDAYTEPTADSEGRPFVSHEPGCCAHRRNRIQGCRRCIEVCPCQAIGTDGDRLHIAHDLCHGCGLCAAACPSGALTLRRPAAGELLERVFVALQNRPNAGPADPLPTVVFHQMALPAGLTDRSAESVHYFNVPAIGGVGLDIWFAALAYGAGRVVLLPPAEDPPVVRREMRAKLLCASAILKGLGLAEERISLAAPEQRQVQAFLEKDLKDWLAERSLPAPGFTPHDPKRRLVFNSIQYLYENGPKPQPYVKLQPEAPFGEIRVTKENCTLCMACAGICPVAALSAGSDRPQLNFRESACIQCGLCRAVCPESAIAMLPRMVFPRESAEEKRVLHQETPFGCIRCGKPVATPTMLEAIRIRLRHHRTFQKPEQFERLRMCRDCRITDIFGLGEKESTMTFAEGNRKQT